MLNSGKKIRALRDKKNKYSNSRIDRKKNSERKKPHSPPPFPCKFNSRSLSLRHNEFGPIKIQEQKNHT